MTDIYSDIELSKKLINETVKKIILPPQPLKNNPRRVAVFKQKRELRKK